MSFAPLIFPSHAWNADVARRPDVAAAQHPKICRPMLTLGGCPLPWGEAVRHRAPSDRALTPSTGLGLAAREPEADFQTGHRTDGTLVWLAPIPAERPGEWTDGVRIHDSADLAERLAARFAVLRRLGREQPAP